MRYSLIVCAEDWKLGVEGDQQCSHCFCSCAKGIPVHKHTKLIFFSQAPKSAESWQQIKERRNKNIKNNPIQVIYIKTMFHLKKKKRNSMTRGNLF
jgi:hypothetical protein